MQLFCTSQDVVKYLVPIRASEIRRVNVNEEANYATTFFPTNTKQSENTLSIILVYWQILFNI